MGFCRRLVCKTDRLPFVDETSTNEVHDAFCRHLRRGWTPLKDKWLVGNERPKIIYELEPDQYNYDGEREFEFEPLFVS